MNKIHFATGSLFRNYKNFVIGTIVISILAIDVLISSKTGFNSNKSTIDATDKQESEVLGANELENETEESLTPILTPEVLSREVEEEKALHTPTQSLAPSSHETNSTEQELVNPPQTTNNSTSVSVPTPTTLTSTIEPTIEPTSENTPLQASLTTEKSFESSPQPTNSGGGVSIPVGQEPVYGTWFLSATVIANKPLSKCVFTFVSGTQSNGITTNPEGNSCSQKAGSNEGTPSVTVNVYAQSGETITLN